MPAEGDLMIETIEKMLIELERGQQLKTSPDRYRTYNAPYSLAIHHETLNFQRGDIRHGFQPTAVH